MVVMFPLGDRSRTIVGASGAICAVAAFAMIPLYGSTASPAVEAIETPVRSGASWSANERLSVPAIADPFVNWSPERSSAGKTLPIARREMNVRVRAIVEGPRALALIDDAGSARMLGIGDRAAGSTVVEIRETEVVLRDGRHLRIEEVER